MANLLTTLLNPQTRAAFTNTSRNYTDPDLPKTGFVGQPNRTLRAAQDARKQLPAAAYNYKRMAGAVAAEAGQKKQAEAHRKSAPIRTWLGQE